MPISSLPTFGRVHTSQGGGQNGDLPKMPVLVSSTCGYLSLRVKVASGIEPADQLTLGWRGAIILDDEIGTSGIPGSFSAERGGGRRVGQSQRRCDIGGQATGKHG